MAPTPDRNAIIGTWRLQTFVREVIATGERQNELGERPQGYISYQPDQPHVLSESTELESPVSVTARDIVPGLDC
jgi:hypothetical protein